METRLLELLQEEPVVLLTGPRAVGKSFTSERVITSLGGTVLSLDDPAERAAAAADPTAEVITYQEVNRVADEFGVSWAVATHQLDNHQIAEVIPD